MVSKWARQLTMSLEEDSALRLEEMAPAQISNYNVILGVGAGQNNNVNVDSTEGIYNVYIGHEAGYTNSTGSKNVGLGYQSLYSNTTGTNNVALGNSALYTNSTTHYNVAVGFEALKASTTSDNVAVGYLAASDQTTGTANVALGAYTLDLNTKGTGNVAVGYQALNLFNNTAGDSTLNTAIGYAAMQAATTGKTNTAVGGNALGGATLTGDDNCALGFSALVSKTSGSNDVAIGREAGFSNATGSANVFIGYQAGYSETGSNKLYIANSNTATPLIGGTFPNTAVVFTADSVTNASQPAFLAHNSATDADATGDGTAVTVDFDTEVFDQGADFASDTFTAPVTGRHLLSAAVSVDDSNGTYGWVKIATSNRDYYGTYLDADDCAADANGILNFVVSCIADMDANDTATVTVELGGGAKKADVRGDSNCVTFFSGALLC